MLKSLEKLKIAIETNLELIKHFNRIELRISGLGRGENSDLPYLKYTQADLDEAKYVTTLLRRGFELKVFFTKVILRYYEFTRSDINLEILYPEEIELNNLLETEFQNYFRELNAGSSAGYYFLHVLDAILKILK